MSILSIFEINEKQLNEYIEDIKSIDIDDDVISKYYAFACDSKEVKEYDCIVLKLDSYDMIQYKSSFKYTFVQSITNPLKFILPHDKAKKLLVILFEDIKGYER